MRHIFHHIARTGIKTEPAPAPDPDMVVVARLQASILRMLGRALAIRHVDAGSCNGCELEIHALVNPYYNIEGASLGRVSNVIPVDVAIPGCPPSPTALLQGILAAISVQAPAPALRR